MKLSDEKEGMNYDNSVTKDACSVEMRQALENYRLE